MAWPSKNHLENLEEILMRLHWLLQPDTVLTELPYDLEFVSKTDMERFADWCRSSVSKNELEQKKYTISKSLVKFFVDNTFRELQRDQQQEKVDSLYKKLHELLNVALYIPITLSNENVDKIIDLLNEIPGESHFDKTTRRIKIGVALKWLQNREVADQLSPKTKDFIQRLGLFYGKAKKGEHVYVDEIGNHRPSPDDQQRIIDDFKDRVELALMEASQEIRQIKERYERDSDYGQFVKIVERVKRMERFIEGTHDDSYDYIEQFKDSILIVIILNYIQDPYIKRLKEAANLLKLILPIYTKFKDIEQLAKK